MKINGNSAPPKAAGAQTAAPGQSASAARPLEKPSGNGGAPDAAARLSQLEAQFSKADFNAAKVAEISSALAAGRYQINSGAIADGLISSALALGKGKSGA
jgi:negative regulator of flagellin synthesis FlgM